MKKILLSVNLLLPCLLLAQANAGFFIEGRILDHKNREPIAYANLYETHSGKGTITNPDGYFRLKIERETDSVRVTFVGYKTEWILPTRTQHRYEIMLEENEQLLSEITIRASDNDYLYDLLLDCRKNPSKAKAGAKTYYELKSFVDQDQIELVEGFFNADLSGYDLSQLSLKNGRIALQPYQNQFFISTESSKAISTLKLYEPNDYFPQNPFGLSKRKMKKSYYLDVSKKYRDDNQDSIYIVNFTPGDTSGNFFKGQVWINIAHHHIVKIHLKCPHATIFPFIPLFPDDSIRKVDLDITKSFQDIDGKPFFKHINFAYQVTYKSRVNLLYTVSTQAVLYTYDFNSLFSLPKFEYSDPNLSDYRKINAIPYNEYFWKNNDELRLNDEKNKNEQFFNDVHSLTNKVFFLKNPYFDKGLLEHPYQRWTGNRVRFREFTADSTASKPGDPRFQSDQYNISVKLFLDVNEIADSVHCMTAAILDPYESFYKLPITPLALCFINLCFDLYEIERRNLERNIQQSDRQPETINALYQLSSANIEKVKMQYLKEVNHGENRPALAKWNKYVFDQLGIDNLIFFNIQ